jgi:hypothetical protein
MPRRPKPSTGCLDPPGHVEVKHQHIGAVAPHVTCGVGDISGLGDHLPSRLALEYQPQPVANDRVVVSQDDPQGVAPGADIRGFDDLVGHDGRVCERTRSAPPKPSARSAAKTTDSPLDAIAGSPVRAGSALGG